MNHASCVLALSVALAVTTLSGVALAQPTAEELYQLGEDAVKVRKFDEACAAFEKSYEMSDGKGALYGLAKCDEARGGRLATQLKNWKDVRDRFADKPSIVSEAEARIQALTGQVAKLTIRRSASAPADLRAEVDGRTAAFDEAIPLDAGKHSIVGTSGGAPPERVDAYLRDGEAKEIVLPLAVKPLACPPGDESCAAVPPVEGSTFPWTTAGIVAGGVGLAGLVVFAISTPILAGASSDIEDACGADRRCPDAASSAKADAAASDAEAWQVPNIVGLIVGVAGVGAGVTFLVIGSQSDGSVEAAIGPGHVGVRGSF